MRTRIQLTKAQAARPAARPGPAPPASPAARALQAAEARARMEEMTRNAAPHLGEDRGVLLREPPLYERMPDPATLPGLQEIGFLKLPVYVNTKDGMNAARLDAEFNDARFGVRFRDSETRRKVATNQNPRVEPRHAKTNLYSLFGEKAGHAATRGSQAPSRLKMRDMFRPGEEPKRKQIPIRVVVIDSAGTNPPVDVAVLVGRNDLVSNLVQGIRAKLAIPVKEKIVLASVQFKHYDEKRQGKPGALFQGCSKVNVLYTCATDKDGKVLADANRVDAGRNPDPALPFDKRAVQGVIGFSREVPPDSPVNLDALARDYVENKSSNAKAAKLNDPVQPDDVLVAYRLPENTADVVIVYPCYHDDITKVKAEAEEAKKRKLETQKRVEKIKQARKEARRAVADPYDSEYDSDNPYYDSSDEDMEHDLNAFADEKKTWIKPFSFPLIMPVPKDGVRDVTNHPQLSLALVV